MRDGNSLEITWMKYSLLLFGNMCLFVCFSVVGIDVNVLHCTDIVIAMAITIVIIIVAIFV